MTVSNQKTGWKFISTMAKWTSDITGGKIIKNIYIFALLILKACQFKSENSVQRVTEPSFVRIRFWKIFTRQINFVLMIWQSGNGEKMIMTLGKQMKWGFYFDYINFKNIIFEAQSKRNLIWLVSWYHWWLDVYTRLFILVNIRELFIEDAR